MEIWIDAQLSPSLALWINQNFHDVKAMSLWSLGLRDATDIQVFQKAKESQAIVMTKDIDFVKLQEQFGTPPQIIWITVGNSSNLRMREILREHLATIILMLQGGEPLIEIEGSYQ